MIESKSLTLEKTVIVGIVNSQQDPNQAKEYLDELAFLVHTAGGIVGQRFVQKMQIPNQCPSIAPLGCHLFIDGDQFLL